MIVLQRIAFLFLLFAAPAWSGEPLTLKECVDQALKNQPAIRSAEASVHAGMGREYQARSPFFPQVTASTGYSESRSLGGALGDSITKSYTTSLSVNQLLYDFGRSGNALAAAHRSTLATQQDAERVRQEIVLNVHQAYYGLLLAKNLVAVAQKTVEQTEQHLRQAEAFLRAGTKPRFEVTRAEVDVNNARLALLNATNGVRLKRIALNNAIGIDPGGATEIAGTLPPLETAALPPIEQAQAEALRNRPEVLKAEQDRDTAAATLDAQRSSYWPTLSANGTYNWNNGTSEMGPFSGSLQNSWNAGVLLTLPLFEGGVTQGKVSEARANLAAAEASLDTAKQAVLLEVNQAYADLESALARTGFMETSLRKARESLELAQGRYEAGVGPSIEVTDAQVAAVNAESDDLQARYDASLAQAKLAKALGRRLY